MASESFDYQDANATLTQEEREIAIESLVACVKFITISSLAAESGAYVECSHWILHQLQSIGIDAQILPESLPKKPVVVGVWTGRDSTLPGILLNGHYDVVPVIADHWNVPAFEGMRKDGKVYGRGTHDMKSVCVQYIVAIRKLIEIGHVPERTIYLSFVPDEEVGGIDGMNILLNSTWFTTMSIGLALDEGLANVGDDYSVFYGERLPWWVKVKAVGNTGHASRFIEGTAVEQVLGVTQRALAFRKEQRDMLHGDAAASAVSSCSHAVCKKKSLGDVTTLNITMLRSGVQAGGLDVLNVVPVLAEAGMDIRIAPDMPPQAVSDMLDKWCRECSLGASNLPEGGGVRWEFAHKTQTQHSTTSCDASVNPWWGVFSSTLTDHCRIQCSAEVFPAATDSRFLRAMGIRAFGFSPIRRSQILLHEHNEFLHENVFIEGCHVYITIIRILSSQARFAGDDVPN